MYIGQPGHDKHNIKSGINLLVSAVISISHSHNEIVFVLPFDFIIINMQYFFVRFEWNGSCYGLQYIKMAMCT